MAILTSSDGLVGADQPNAHKRKIHFSAPSILTSSNRNASEKQNEGSKAIAYLPQQNRPALVIAETHSP